MSCSSTTNCFSQDTHVLTENHGFVKIRDIHDSERNGPSFRIGTIDIKSGNIEFEMPKTTISSNNDELYRFRGQGVDQLVSRHHEIVVRKNGSYHSSQGKWEVRNVGNVVNDFNRQKFDILRSADWSGNDVCSFGLESDHPNGNRFESGGDTFLSFLGWYISEGWVKNNNKGRIHISQNEGGRGDIIEIINNTTLTPHTNDDKIKTTNKVLSKWLMNNCGNGSKDKKVPRIVKGVSKRQINVFLTSLFRGDGVINDGGEITHYYTSSRTLAHDVIELLTKSGRSSNLRKRDREYNINGYSGRSETYEICVGDKKKSYYSSLCKEPEVIKYGGATYKIETDNEAVAMMRNGCVSLS